MLFHMTGWEYLANLFHVFGWYISQLFYPYGVVMAWTTRILHDHISWYVGGLVLLLMFSYCFCVKCSKEKILASIVSFNFVVGRAVCLAAFIRPDNGAQIEPHWFIVSSIGFFVLMSWFCLFVIERSKKIGPVLLFALLVLWGGISHANNRLWADQKTYAFYWARQSPDLKSTYFYLADAIREKAI